MEGSRKPASHYGPYQNSYSCSNGQTSIYGCLGTPLTHLPSQLREDYRPIYFYVTQPCTIPYTFAKRPNQPHHQQQQRQSSLQKSGKQRVNYRVKFSKKLSSAEFSNKVKQGEFSKSLNQVQFVNNTVSGVFFSIIRH